jgi:hypothetical protein
MDYVIACPNCAGHLKVSDRMVGFTITCPKCGNPCIPDPPPWWKPKASGQESTLFARLMPSLPPLAVGLLAGLVMGGAGGFFIGDRDATRREAVKKALATPDPESETGRESAAPKEADGKTTPPSSAEDKSASAPAPLQQKTPPSDKQ